MASIESGASAVPAAVVVDLIGDLDAVLCGVLAETLVKLTRDGTRTVLLTTKYLTTASDAGIAGVSDALASASACGLDVALEPGNRKIRAAFAGARFPSAERSPAPQPERARHYMFAHHEAVKRNRAGGAARSL